MIKNFIPILIRLNGHNMMRRNSCKMKISSFLMMMKKRGCYSDNMSFLNHLHPSKSRKFKELSMEVSLQGFGCLESISTACQEKRV